MLILCTIVFALFIIGFCLLLDINVYKQISSKPLTMRKYIEIVNGAPGNFITRRFRQMKEMLIISGREKLYTKYCYISAALGITCSITALLLGNFFLVPVMFIIGLLVPQFYVYFSSRDYKRECDREAETAMSIITSSYDRTENILRSVDENIDYIHEPIKSVLKSFLSECEFLTANIETAISHMKAKVNNDIWVEWCEALILCQHDRTKKDMLEPIIIKLRNTESVQTELDATLYKPVKDFVVMVVLVLINFPMLYFLSKTWFNYLIFTVPGKLAVTFVFAVLLFSMFSVVKTIKPIEYKR